MAIQHPQTELPVRLTGASDIWDQPQASVILLDDFFQTGSLPSGGFKYWNGSGWVEAVLKRWDGSNWVNAVLKRWDGASWVTV